ncbi:mitochondrial carrier-7 [Lipomyces oligophaga]|uniref:mitochondrial carrier-7 n=1 Tax=Lipomyces oligophaga TaxID=45792 RepID=UPI0034CE0ED5
MATDHTKKHYGAGFVAGMCSGVTKICVGHPFDTVKVRLQTAPEGQFKSFTDCFLSTIRNEGFMGLYKGAGAPLVGWSIMDSVQLGSLQLYRKVLKQTVYAEDRRLPTMGHAIAGLLGGLTVCIVATPVEHVKARLQVQYGRSGKGQYSGTLDCATKLIKEAGIFRGLYHGFASSLIFRTHFFFYWGAYDILSRWMSQYMNLSTPTINFMAGGFSSQIGWVFGLPPDVIKQMIMTDNIAKKKYPTWMSAATEVYRHSGWRGYFKGFIPCMLRSFPTNAASLLVFEGVLRSLGDTQ